MGPVVKLFDYGLTGRLSVGLTWGDQRFTNIKIQNYIRIA